MVTHEIHVEAVLATIAKRHAGNGAEVVDALREIWESVAGDLAPEEAAAVLWSLSPGDFVLGSHAHRRAFAAFAVSLFPLLSPGQACARLRRVLARPAVRSTLGALRAEEAAHAMHQRARVRALLWELAETRAPDEYEPKDRNAHNANRLKAFAALVRLDGLDAPPDASEAAAAPEEDGRKKLVDRLRALG